MARKRCSDVRRAFSGHPDDSLPDYKHERLKALAKSNSISINKLMDEPATGALANYDARVRFETRTARGNPNRALALLDKLDRAD